MLTLRPTGGLCNRMLAINSAIKLCLQHDLPLQIIWIKNKYLNASFFDLFEGYDHLKIPVTFVESESQKLLYSDRELPLLKQRIYNALLKLYQRIYYDKVLHGYETKKAVLNKTDFGFIRNYEKVLITSWTSMDGSPINCDYFKPIPQLNQRLLDVTSKFNYNTIGIHIRRGDHVSSIASSPTQLFIDKMDAELNTNPNTRFFLASDSSEVKELLIGKYKDKIIVAESLDGDRLSSRGMQIALIDLYALASSVKIYGSAFSTFSSVASELYGITFEELSLKN